MKVNILKDLTHRKGVYMARNFSSTKKQRAIKTLNIILEILNIQVYYLKRVERVLMLQFILFQEKDFLLDLTLI